MEFAPALFSTRITNGHRTFFVDIKATKDRKPYMKITESTITPEGEKKKNYMTIFEPELADFKNAIGQAVEFVNTATSLE